MVLAQSHLGSFCLLVCRASNPHIHLLVSLHLQVFHRFVLIDHDLDSTGVRPLLRLVSLLGRFHSIPLLLHVTLLDPRIDQRLLFVASCVRSIGLQVQLIRVLSILADFDFSVVTRSVLPLNTSLLNLAVGGDGLVASG